MPQEGTTAQATPPVQEAAKPQAPEAQKTADLSPAEQVQARRLAAEKRKPVMDKAREAVAQRLANPNDKAKTTFAFRGRAFSSLAAEAAATSRYFAEGGEGSGKSLEQQAADMRDEVWEIYRLRGDISLEEFNKFTAKDIVDDARDYAGTVARELFLKDFLNSSADEIRIQDEAEQLCLASEDKLGERVNLKKITKKFFEGIKARNKSKRALGRAAKRLKLDGKEATDLRRAHDESYTPSRKELTPEQQAERQRDIAQRRDTAIKQIIAETWGQQYADQDLDAITDPNVRETIISLRKNEALTKSVTLNDSLLDARHRLVDAARGMDMDEIKRAMNHVRSAEFDTRSCGKEVAAVKRQLRSLSNLSKNFDEMIREGIVRGKLDAAGAHRLIERNEYSQAAERVRGFARKFDGVREGVRNSDEQLVDFIRRGKRWSTFYTGRAASKYFDGLARDIQSVRETVGIRRKTLVTNEQYSDYIQQGIQKRMGDKGITGEAARQEINARAASTATPTEAARPAQAAATGASRTEGTPRPAASGPTGPSGEAAPTDPKSSTERPAAQTGPRTEAQSTTGATGTTGGTRTEASAQARPDARAETVEISPEALKIIKDVMQEQINVLRARVAADRTNGELRWKLRQAEEAHRQLDGRSTTDRSLLIDTGLRVDGRPILTSPPIFADIVESVRGAEDIVDTRTEKPLLLGADGRPLTGEALNRKQKAIREQIRVYLTQQDPKITDPREIDRITQAYIGSFRSVDARRAEQQAQRRRTANSASTAATGTTGPKAESTPRQAAAQNTTRTEAAGVGAATSAEPNPRTGTSQEAGNTDDFDLSGITMESVVDVPEYHGNEERLRAWLRDKPQELQRIVRSKSETVLDGYMDIVSAAHVVLDRGDNGDELRHSLVTADAAWSSDKPGEQGVQFNKNRFGKSNLPLEDIYTTSITLSTGEVHMGLPLTDSLMRAASVWVSNVADGDPRNLDNPDFVQNLKHKIRTDKNGTEVDVTPEMVAQAIRIRDTLKILQGSTRRVSEVLSQDELNALYAREEGLVRGERTDRGEAINEDDVRREARRRIDSRRIIDVGKVEEEIESSYLEKAFKGAEMLDRTTTEYLREEAGKRPGKIETENRTVDLTKKALRSYVSFLGRNSGGSTEETIELEAAQSALMQLENNNTGSVVDRLTRTTNGDEFGMVVSKERLTEFQKEIESMPDSPEKEDLRRQYEILMQGSVLLDKSKLTKEQLVALKPTYEAVLREQVMLAKDELLQTMPLELPDVLFEKAKQLASSRMASIRVIIPQQALRVMQSNHEWVTAETTAKRASEISTTKQEAVEALEQPTVDRERQALEMERDIIQALVRENPDKQWMLDEVSEALRQMNANGSAPIGERLSYGTGVMHEGREVRAGMPVFTEAVAALKQKVTEAKAATLPRYNNKGEQIFPEDIKRMEEVVKFLEEASTEFGSLPEGLQKAMDEGLMEQFAEEIREEWAKKGKAIDSEAKVNELLNAAIDRLDSRTAGLRFIMPKDAIVFTGKNKDGEKIDNTVLEIVAARRAAIPQDPRPSGRAKPLGQVTSVQVKGPGLRGRFRNFRRGLDQKALTLETERAAKKAAQRAREAASVTTPFGVTPAEATETSATGGDDGFTPVEASINSNGTVAEPSLRSRIRASVNEMRANTNGTRPVDEGEGEVTPPESGADTVPDPELEEAYQQLQEAYQAQGRNESAESIKTKLKEKVIDQLASSGVPVLLPMEAFEVSKLQEITKVLEALGKEQGLEVNVQKNAGRSGLNRYTVLVEASPASV
jgi:hypothetical protein